MAVAPEISTSVVRSGVARARREPSPASPPSDVALARSIFTAVPAAQHWLTEHFILAWSTAILIHVLFGTCLTVWNLPASPAPATLVMQNAWFDDAADETHALVLEELPEPLQPPPITAAISSPVDLQHDIPQLGAMKFPVLGAAVFDSSLHVEPIITTPSLTSPVMFRNRAKPVGGGYEGRSAEARGRLAAKYGGNEETEQGVELALAWLAAHQQRDGSWRFNHGDGECDGRCQNRGTASSTTGATALALLPFLGAGYTHREGPYQQVVGRGLHYLASRAVKTSRGIDFQEGTMYAHGISAVVLCEAYTMTQDEALRPLAQGALEFIVNSQHSAGGWRYFPGQAGDTTVFGWQMLAVKSAKAADLFVPDETSERATMFLDSVASVDGSSYGYQTAGCEKSPTAVGLLTRMSLGCERTNPQLQAGVRRLVAWGPSKTDMYFNFYATQVLLHNGGPDWQNWNQELREHLLNTQVLDGHAAGSWFFSDRHAYAGGRLYTTAVCALMLEVYYRHLPLYGEVSGE